MADNFSSSTQNIDSHGFSIINYSNSCTQTEYVDIFEEMFNQMSHPSFIIDLNTNPMKISKSVSNPAATELMKLSKGNFFQNATLERFDGPLDSYIASVSKRTARIYKYVDVLHVMTDNNEKEKIYEFNSVRLKVSSETQYVGIFLVKITDQINDKIDTIKDFKNSLIAALSHELNNPINSLIQIIEMMPICYSSDKKNNLKDMALNNVSLLNQKIKDFIDYARMEIKELKLNFKEFEIDKLFNKLKERFKNEVESKGNKLTVSIKTHDNSSLVILGDEDRLKQILYKLISNANKYTEKGEIILKAEDQKNNFNVAFSINDTGTGISKEKLDFLFAPLHQKNLNKELAKLPGLGLDIAKNLCKCMDSKLNVFSEEGKGTIFFFELPMCRINKFSQAEYLEVSKPINKTKKRYSEIKEGPKIIEDRSKFIRADSLHQLKINKSAKSSNNIMEISCINLLPNKSSLKAKTDNYININEEDSNVEELINHYKFSMTNMYNLFETKKIDKSTVRTNKKRPVVLITDDSFYNRMIMSEILKSQNVETIQAINGEQATKVVKDSFLEQCDFEIKLILMDLNMPVMNGIEATEKIRSLEESLNHNKLIPIVAVTAQTSKDDRIGCFRANMQEFIPKPVSKKILKEIIAKYTPELISK